MKLRIAVLLILFTGLCFSFGCTGNPGDVTESKEAQGVQMASMEKPVLTVLNPLGTPPPIKLKAMAPRMDTLENKTIYIINDGYPGSGILLGELKAVMEGKYPKTNFVYRDKPGGFGREDATIWKEMEEKADAMIIALGH
ncbi:hypothetical protein ACFL1N_11680 [Thermodesulfobacteriota bacterium]